MFIKTLCLSGGGVTGLAHVGVLQRLHEEKMLRNLNTLVATSIGSVVAVLFAIGCLPMEINEYLVNINETALKFSSIDNFFLSFGLDSGEYFMAHLVDKFMDKRISPNITFKELYNIKNKNVVITGTNLDAHAPVYFNVETSPDMKVLEAVRISISVPFILSAVPHKGNFYVDGGVTDNFPFKFCLNDMEKKIEKISDRFSREKILNTSILGCCIGSLPPKKINNIEDFLYNIFACSINTKDVAYFDDPRVIFIPTEAFTSLSFTADKKQKEKLFKLGYEAASYYLKTKKSHSMKPCRRLSI